MRAGGGCARRNRAAMAFMPNDSTRLFALSNDLAFTDLYSVDASAPIGELDLALRYAAWAAHTAEGRALHKGGVLFRTPRKIDVMQLVPLETTRVGDADAWKLAGGHVRRRSGFALTDPGMDFARALGES